jgi:hypothetical protein
MSFIENVIISMLMGYEIIDQTEKTCVIKNLSGDDVSEFEAIVRRTFLISLSMAKNSLEDLETKNHGKLKEQLALEKINNKLVNYCLRLLNKQPYKKEKTIFSYLILWVLESICDDYKDLIKLLLKEDLKNNISKEFKEAYKKTNDLFEDYYHLYYSYSNQKMMNLKNKISALRTKIIITEFKAKEKEYSYFLFSITNRLLDSLGSTMGLNY